MSRDPIEFVDVEFGSTRIQSCDAFIEQIGSLLRTHPKLLIFARRLGILPLDFPVTLDGRSIVEAESHVFDTCDYPQALVGYWVQPADVVALLSWLPLECLDLELFEGTTVVRLGSLCVDEEHLQRTSVIGGVRAIPKLQVAETVAAGYAPRELAYGSWHNVGGCEGNHIVFSDAGKQRATPLPIFSMAKVLEELGIEWRKESITDLAAFFDFALESLHIAYGSFDTQWNGPIGNLSWCGDVKRIRGAMENVNPFGTHFLFNRDSELVCSIFKSPRDEAWTSMVRGS